MRLENSAKLLYMELPFSVEELHAACMELIGANGRALTELAPPRLAHWPESLDEAGCAERLSRECDRLVALRDPHRFHAVSQFYESFDDVGEDRVRDLLSAAKPAVEIPA